MEGYDSEAIKAARRFLLSAGMTAEELALMVDATVVKKLRLAWEEGKPIIKSLAEWWESLPEEVRDDT